jgi:hypothetical protein
MKVFENRHPVWFAPVRPALPPPLATFAAA